MNKNPKPIFFKRGKKPRFKISRDMLKTAVDVYLKDGGIITRIKLPNGQEPPSTDHQAKFHNNAAETNNFLAGDYNDIFDNLR